MIAGPIGALIGSIAQKDRGAVFLTLITPDDVFIEKVSGLEEVKAREFATKVKRAGMLQTREAAENAKAEAAALAASVPALPSPSQQGIPAGWYPRGDVQQYWDGSAWTDHTAPLV